MGSVASVALVGLDGRVVQVESAIGGGLPRTVLVGLPDAALYQARDRCRAAYSSSGLTWPQHLLTINLSPATLPKGGSHYDLAITASVLVAAGEAPPDRLVGTVMLGELGLDGRVRRIRGLLPALLAAVRFGCVRAVVPADQLSEAQLVPGASLVPVASLAQLLAWLRHQRLPAGPGPETGDEPIPAPVSPCKDLVDVAGQPEARWALEVAAAGRHHLFLHGPPGVGKTMLAERLPGLLPDLTVAEALEVSAVHSLAGWHLDGRLDRRPPYADPHHSASVASVVGGGPRIARPGAISCAHRGVLFLDEAPEFPGRVLDALRTPLEQGSITLGRSEMEARYPARFQLVMAANPCPCGQAATAGAACTCAPVSIRRYADRISGPIRDRVDIQQSVVPLRSAFLRGTLEDREDTATVAARVLAARSRQQRRLAGTGWHTNGEVSGSYLRTKLPLPDGLGLVEDAVSRGRISPRGVDKILRLSWTLCDLAGTDRPSADHVHAALAMRRGGTGGGWGSAA